MNDSFDCNYCSHMWLPFCSSNRALGIEYGNVAGFVTIAFFLVDSLGAGKRFGRATSSFDILEQSRLIFLELNDQMSVSNFSGFECFFWQCIASQVTMRPATLSSSSSF